MERFIQTQTKTKEALDESVNQLNSKFEFIHLLEDDEDITSANHSTSEPLIKALRASSGSTGGKPLGEYKCHHSSKLKKT